MSADLSFVAPLFVPANRPERIAKAAASGADAIIVDLEDAVPASEKAVARKNLFDIASPAVPLIVRINAVGSPFHLDDLAVLRSVAAIAVLLPKTEAPQSIPAIEGASGPVALIGLIETAAGVENAGSLAASGRLGRLAFGPADFFAEMQMEPNLAMAASVMARLAIASRAAGLVNPLAGPCFKFAPGDETILAECASDLQHGAGGKLCIHPSQPKTVHQCFRPTRQQLAWAEAILSGSASGEGAFSVQGEMVDAPVVARARSVINREQAALAVMGKG